MSLIIGIDPGPRESALVVLDTVSGQPVVATHERNGDILMSAGVWLENDDTVMAYEWVQNYGRVVGEEVLRTAHTCGALACITVQHNRELYEPTRPMIVRHFTGQNNVPKAHVRQALRDRFGGKQATKKGQKLHGITTHKWDALAVCIYIAETEYGINESFWKQESGSTW